MGNPEKSCSEQRPSTALVPLPSRGHDSGMSEIPVHPADSNEREAEYQAWPERLELNSLLAWSTAHSDRDNSISRPREPIDPRWIEVILGRSNAVRMRDSLEVIKSSSEFREAAWEDLQELLEDLDNASDFGKLGLWPDLIKIARESEDEETRSWACWCVAVAVQNHAKATELCVENQGMSALMHVLRNGGLESKAKSVLAISSLVRGSGVAFSQFYQANGFKDLLFPHLTESDLHENKLRQSMVRKVLFLLTQLLAMIPDLGEKLLEAVPSLEHVFSIPEDLDILVKGVECVAAFVGAVGSANFQCIMVEIPHTVKDHVDEQAWAQFESVYRPRLSR